MAYTKQVWHTGDTITQEGLNHIEDGIASNDQSIASINSSITDLEDTITELGNQSKYEIVDDGDGLEIIIGGDSP